MRCGCVALRSRCAHVRRRLSVLRAAVTRSRRLQKRRIARDGDFQRGRGDIRTPRGTTLRESRARRRDVAVKAAWRFLIAV